MRLLLAALCTAFVLGATPAFAQTATEPTAQPPVATAPAQPKFDPAELKKRGEAIIKAAGAEDFLEAVPDERFIVLRHPESGFVSRMSADKPGRVIVNTRLVKRGEDIIFDESLSEDDIFTFYCTKTGNTSLDDEMRMAVEVLQMMSPSAKPRETQMQVGLGSGDGPVKAIENRSLSFELDGPGGKKLLTKVGLAKRNGWTIKMRYTHRGDGTPADLMAGEMISGLRWANAMAQLAELDEKEAD